MGPASHSQQPATMDIFEIAKWKRVSGFSPFRTSLIDPEMPFAVFRESVPANKLILFLGRRTMTSPCIFLINDNMSLSDEFLGISERVFV